MNAKKQFGQNFISDPNLITKIVDLLGNEKDSLVIEIGPGKGALTKQLVKRFKKVIAIEIDRDMEDILNKEINSENFELIIKDALEVDLRELIAGENKKYDYKNVFLISNMPYYITSEILFNTLDVHDLLTKAVFMMQKEVATRVCAKVNENNYNNLSIACDFYATTKYEFTVPKKMFRPIPKVDSAIVSLTFNNDHVNDVKDPQKFISFVRQLFNNRRKTILNNLGRVLGDKEKAKDVLNKTQISENLRPENIDLDQYINLYNNSY
ncbi:16S rRNA (adenine(1518)-N(6)/adenine(1519)-N(6))-dimethyltransferase RsmA [Mesoplasma lactucae]|uniref:Ribosomal RNA small subunit methyltransferase A n=1 Tax=Mesoplasma lactucae ATCC 49193 TaxID=81460 RepID=A0A291IT12_9MOLU|nr:16S rRNA (adenine(1518)-N(6)/adenine(1519)-N(6))-dimethyltransferase [Mesoplasma lactucae ATCC 49193]